MCHCFVLVPAPQIFTKLLKLPTPLMRRIHIRLLIYFGNLLIMGGTLEKILLGKDKLENLGFGDDDDVPRVYH